MVQIKCLSNGLYSLKNSHIPFGMGFQPYGRIPFEQHLCYIGSTLTVTVFFGQVMSHHDLWKCFLATLVALHFTPVSE